MDDKSLSASLDAHVARDSQHRYVWREWASALFFCIALLAVGFCIVYWRRNCAENRVKFASMAEILNTGLYDPRGVELFTRNDELRRSVRALRDFETDQVVCTYSGRVVPDGVWAADGYDRTYCLRYRDVTGWAMDGHPDFPETENHLGSFINDAEGPVRVDGASTNVRFDGSVVWFAHDPMHVKLVMWLRATRPIRAGEELWVAYGSGYWEARERQRLGGGKEHSKRETGSAQAEKLQS